MATNSVRTSPSPGLSRILQNADVMLAVAVVAIVSMLIVPVPVLLLDVLITVNISVALVVLLVALYTIEPLQFSVFPSLLLITTLFRLSLNISATRLILLQAHAGKVIEAFGSFVVGGNYVVGVVVFLILIVIQFVVITNGAGRVAEVAARFTLDAMPGKQMSIDADLNAGIINDEEARRRRRAIEQEADFYGAMDGASKFVKGDAIAAIVIVLINIVGGFAIGVMQMGMPLAKAIQTYTILTIGDGLVTQIPAILISTATGIIVTRAASESNLGRDVAQQLLGNPRALLIVSGLLLALGLVPGLPKLPFFLMSAALGTVGFLLRRSQQQEAAAQRVLPSPTEDLSKPETVARLLQVEPMELEVGYGLIPLVDAEQGGNLLGRIALIRRQIALDLGIIVPTIRIRDNMQLPPNTYVFKLRGVEVAKGEVRADRFLAMNPGLAEESLEGIATTEPAFGLPATWIAGEHKERAEALGYTVVDPSSVVATHLSEIVKRFAPAILGRQEVQQLVNNLRAEQPAVIEGLVPEMLSMGEVQRILQALLRERVSIRDLGTILEAVGAHAPTSRDPDILAEHARRALARAICHQHREAAGVLFVATLAADLQHRLSKAIQRTEQGPAIAVSPEQAQALLRAIGDATQKMVGDGHQPILLTPVELRLALKRFTERAIPNLVVLSYPEIVPEVEVHTAALVSAAEWEGGLTDSEPGDGRSPRRVA